MRDRALHEVRRSVKKDTPARRLLIRRAVDVLFAPTRDAASSSSLNCDTSRRQEA